MKQSDTSPPAHAIVWINKTQLSVHEAVAQTPEDRALVELLTAEFAAGADIHDPLEISPDNEIYDGRHRWRAALATGRMGLLPCRIVEDADPETLVCTKLTQRRHYSKSAKAYALRHMAAKAAQEGREGRVTGAHNARGLDVNRSNRLTSKKGLNLASLAEKSGLSTDLLQQAVKLERDYMTRADKLVQDWLSLNPEEAESWAAWQDMHPHQDMPWTCWRAARLVELGLKDDPQAVNVIRPNYREIEEDKIFNGVADPDGDGDERKSYSLGASLKALGSIFATAGKPRPDLDPTTPDIVTTLSNKVSTFTRTMWAQWDGMPPDQRQAVCKKLAEDVRTAWPAEARMLLAGLLNAKSAAAAPAA